MPPRVILAGLLAVLFWSGSPIATKAAVTYLSATDVTLLRSLIGGVAALPLILAFRVPRPRSWRQALLLFLSSFAGFVAAPLIYAYGLAMTSAVHGAMILAIAPIVSGLISFIWERRLPLLRWWFGCLLALVGECVLVFLRRDSGTAGVLGDLIAFSSTALAAAGYIAGGRLAQEGYPAQGGSYWGSVMAGLVVLPVAFLHAPALLAGPVAAATWGALVYLAVGATLIGYTLWYAALGGAGGAGGRGGMEKVSMFQFVQPIFSLVLAALLLGEPIHKEVGLAGVMVFIGVFIATRVSRPATPPPVAAD